LIDIDIKYDATTGKAMYRQRGTGNFVNFSNAPQILYANAYHYPSGASYTFDKDYNGAFVIFSQGDPNQRPIQNVTINCSGSYSLVEDKASIYSKLNVYKLENIKQGDSINHAYAMDYSICTVIAW